MTIINNELVADETKLRIISPFFYVPNPDKSEALGLAYLYFGAEGDYPVAEDKRKRVYVLQEDGSAVAISQPIRTSAGGVPVYNGSTVNLAIDGAFSFVALDSSLEQKYYYSRLANPSFSSAGITSIVDDVVTVIPFQTTITFPNVDVTQATIDVSGTSLVDPSVIDSRPLIRDLDYTVLDGGAGTINLIVAAFPTGTTLRARQNASTAQAGELSSIPNVYTQPDIATAITVNFEVGNTVKILSDSAANDGLTNDYEVVANGTGTNDGINFIGLDNSLQFRLIKTRDKLQAYTEATGEASILSGVLTVDANKGTVQTVILTENVSSFIFGNVSADGSTTIQLALIQDGTGSRSVDFTGFISAGGVAPTISTGIDEVDIFVFQSSNESAWSIFQAGLNMAVI